MRVRSSGILFLSVLVGFNALCCNAQKKTTNDEENTIISLVLRPFAKAGGYTILAPRTRLSHFDFSKVEKIAETKQGIKKELKIPGREITHLIDRLFEKNRIEIALSLKSDTQKGYLIDTDGKFKEYFKDGCGEWEKFYSDNPKAIGMTTVSVPVFDKRDKVVLIYVGTQLQGLDGYGRIIVYSYKNGILTKLKSHMLWIS